MEASGASAVWFLVLVAGVGAAFVWGLARPTPADARSGLSLSWAVVAVVVLALWLGIPAGVAARGTLADFSGRPPAMAVLLVALVTGTTAVALSPVGSRLLANTGIGALVGFQVFRVPLELLLHRLYGEGVLPVQMTYSGYNFDIVSGLLAAVVGLWALAGRPGSSDGVASAAPPAVRDRRGDGAPPRWAVAAFNVIGTLLLVNIVTIALLSMPTPLRVFHNDPPNTFVAHLPYVWLPSLLVQAAWFGHLLVFRWLLRGRR